MLAAAGLLLAAIFEPRRKAAGALRAEPRRKAAGALRAEKGHNQSMAKAAEAQQSETAQSAHLPGL